MSIKVMLGEAKTQSKKPFPKVMISKDGMIVLFEFFCKGTVLFEKKPLYGIGYTSCSWAIIEFSDYCDSITLQNT